MTIDLIAGARPNFIKIAPIIDAIIEEQKKSRSIHYRLVHTGQHYDNNMSGSFFEQLGIPLPDVNLEAGGGTQAEQTAKIMVNYEQLLTTQVPDLCMVVGDVTSTLACSIVAKKQHIKVAHIEGGIRSGDLTMPEEINRIVTDSITDYFFTTSETANKNLRNNGIPDERIYFVGNTMIDTLLKNRSRFQQPALWDQMELIKRKYIVMTLHRPANVDEQGKLKALLEEIIRSANKVPIIFPVHPRTDKIIRSLSLNPSTPQPFNLSTPQPLNSTTLHICPPLGYLEFNYLVENAMAVITDSGGITEETTVMGIPCITLRDNTERPETIEIGTNELIGTNLENIKPAFEKLFFGNWKKGTIPQLWDGHTAERIVQHLLEIYGEN